MNHGKDEAVVCAGCLLFIPATCTQQDKEDALNSTLYMQLAASKKHSRFTEFAQWDDTFVRASIAFGWQLKGNVNLRQTPPDIGPRTLWDWIKADLPSFIPAEVLMSAQAQIRHCYLTDPDQSAIRLYADQVQQRTPLSSSLSGDQDQHGHTACKTNVSLQLGFLSPDSALCMIGVSFTSLMPLEPDFMFQPIAAHNLWGDIELTFYALRNQEQEFSRNRSLISAALVSRREALISPLRETADGQ